MPVCVRSAIFINNILQYFPVACSNVCLSVLFHRIMAHNHNIVINVLTFRMFSFFSSLLPIRLLAIILRTQYLMLREEEEKKEDFGG